MYESILELNANANHRGKLEACYNQNKASPSRKYILGWNRNVHVVREKVPPVVQKGHGCYHVDNNIHHYLGSVCVCVIE